MLFGRRLFGGIAITLTAAATCQRTAVQSTAQQAGASRRFKWVLLCYPQQHTFPVGQYLTPAAALDPCKSKMFSAEIGSPTRFRSLSFALALVI